MVILLYLLSIQVMIYLAPDAIAAPYQFHSIILRKRVILPTSQLNIGIRLDCSIIVHKRDCNPLTLNTAIEIGDRSSARIVGLASDRTRNARGRVAIGERSDKAARIAQANLIV
jgi:hypothetical protein